MPYRNTRIEGIHDSLCLWKSIHDLTSSHAILSCGLSLCTGNTAIIIALHLVMPDVPIYYQYTYLLRQLAIAAFLIMQF